MRRILFRACFVALAGLWLVQTTPGRAEAQVVGSPPATNSATNSAENAAGRGMEVMTRGPIHEAFAQPVNTGSIHPLIVPKSPPAAIEETPPDAKPAGENVLWISGYWGWDDDRNDFVWVSGVWRVPPPGQRWVPGYWTQVSTGYQWVPGFWAPANNEEVEYYPEPPQSMELGPTSEAPSPEYVWISGCWRWREARYVWQPGYWALAEPDWLWVPASYSWCPRGWVFNEGYWDYPLAGRGLMFAPVYFNNAGRLRPGFAFSPTVAIDTGVLSFYLFTRPSYCHYYFGDYFAASYDGIGIFPWFGVHAYGGYLYDPLFSYYRWHYSHSDPRWLANLEGWHRYYREHADRRPPHDLAAERQLLAEAKDRPDRRFLSIADTLENLRQDRNAPVSLVAVSADQKMKTDQMARLMERFSKERAESETKAAIGEAAGSVRPSQLAQSAPLKAPVKAPLPKVSVMGQSPGESSEIALGPKANVPSTPGTATGGEKPATRPEATAPKAAPGMTPQHTPPKTAVPERPEASRGGTPGAIIGGKGMAKPRIMTPEPAPGVTPQQTPPKSAVPERPDASRGGAPGAIIREKGTPKPRIMTPEPAPGVTPQQAPPKTVVPRQNEPSRGEMYRESRPSFQAPPRETSRPAPSYGNAPTNNSGRRREAGNK